jgi:hypothetical protein
VLNPGAFNGYALRFALRLRGGTSPHRRSSRAIPTRTVVASCARRTGQLVDHREHSVAGQTSRPSAAVRERPLLGKLSRPMAPWFGEQATTQTLPQAKLGRNDDTHPQLERDRVELRHHVPQDRSHERPFITSAISEFDAARMVGHTPESLTLECVGRTAVTRGTDFCHNGVRYQVKACRPSGKAGSFVTCVPKATNYDWDRLIWILYDRGFHVCEAWEWAEDRYGSEFDAVKRLSPLHMRGGRSLHTA